MKYSDEIQKIVSNIHDKKYMISLGKNVINKNLILNATQWMDTLYPIIPLKIRCLAIQLNYTKDTFPKCPNCESHVGFQKEYCNGFNKFCSDKCSKEYGRLPQEAKEKLNDFDWLYSKRLIEKLSYENIGVLLNCSEIPVKRACKKLNIPNIRLNESNPEVMEKLRNKDWLFDQHITQHKQLWKIAEEIGSTASTLSRYFDQHNITTNPTNSYDRKFPKVSKAELEIREFLDLHNIRYESNKISFIGHELDVRLLDYPLAIEHNGLMSHCRINHIWPDIFQKEDKHYHLKKTLAANAKGYQLFHVFSDDWSLKKDIVKSMIISRCGLSNKIYARNCDVIEIDKISKLSFLEANHLQGKDKSSIAYGLLYNGELISIMTFCKSRYNKNYEWELSRFATKKFNNVVGGFSKLLQYFRKHHKGSIISYADRSYSEGKVYEKNGFRLLKTNPPGYAYTDNFARRLHRTNFMKKKIAPDDPRTEAEIMLERGFSQVYDCGTLAFVLD